MTTTPEVTRRVAEGDYDSFNAFSKAAALVARAYLDLLAEREAGREAVSMAVAAEREACATIADKRHHAQKDQTTEYTAFIAGQIASEIRERALSRPQREGEE